MAFIKCQYTNDYLLTLEQLWLLQEATGVADTTEISEMMVFAEIAVYVQKRISART